ncbi:MAG TPA: gamma-glutamyl-gamma-aminobutyrate hydrolase family protein [Ktedonobacteraceae bacterium]|nr:gamma-glutamyl-gamma-aminobutyrate hydrolase family protein [Ktedonobacteraceae bacterium]
MRPLIGIPCHALIRAETGRPIYANNRSYVHAVESGGGIPVLIPMLKDLTMLTALLSRLDGLLLPGGIDLHPSHYDEEVHPLTEDADQELDEFEINLASLALQQDMPVLGICRGMQLLNIVLGGTLIQDIDLMYPDNVIHSHRDWPRTHFAHKISVEPGSRMEKILGTSEVRVNSLHHQAIKELGKGVRITGRSPDGIPELLEVSGYRFVMAVQGHPEEIYTIEPAFKRLFAAFVEASCPRMAEEGANDYSLTRSEVPVGSRL